MISGKQQQRQKKENDANKLEKAKTILRQYPDISNDILEFILSLPDDQPVKKVTDKLPIIAKDEQQQEMEERLARDSMITRVRNAAQLSFEKYPDKYR